MRIEQTSSPTETDPKWVFAAHLDEHFDAIRGSWNVDGRGQIQGWKDFRDRIAAGVTDVAKLPDDMGVCPVGKGHWADDCGEVGRGVRVSRHPGGFGWNVGQSLPLRWRHDRVQLTARARGGGRE